MPYIEQLPSGTWRIIVHHNGQRRSVTGKTRGEATRKAAEVLLSLGGRPPASPTVRDLIDSHLAAAQERLSPTTWADYKRLADRLPEHFTQRNVTDVTPAIVEHLQRALAADGWSPHRVGRIHNLLGVAWRSAERYGWANTNPTHAVKKPYVASPEIHPPSAAEIIRILDVAAPKFALFLQLAATMGARRGELVGLQWGDLRLDTGEMIVRRSLVYTPESGVVERDTKTGRKGHRVISIGSATVTALRSLRTEQAEMATAAGLNPVWVFSHDAGHTPWRPDYPSREFTRTCERAGVATVRLHDLRHFVATQMLANGDTAVQVAARLGHANAVTTLNTYAHWVPAADRAAADYLEGLVARGRESVERRAARLDGAG